MSRYVVKFELAYYMLIKYRIGTLVDERLNNMMDLLGQGCISLMTEYVGTHNTESHHNWKVIDNIYIPAIKTELAKLKIFDMKTCHLRVKGGSGNGHYSTIMMTVDLSDIGSNINYLKLKSPHNYSALMDFTKEIVKKDMIKF